MTEPAELKTFTTPNGNPARFWIRPDSNDWNVAASVSLFDEYALRGLALAGWALDLGGHLGSVGICAAIDNPGLQVVIVEPIPDNVEIARANARENGVEGRVQILQQAVGPAGEHTVVRYGFKGNEHVEHNRFVGNVAIVYEQAPPIEHTELEVECVDLLALPLYAAYGPPSFVKVDCEGAEWTALADIVALGSPRVVGEWHPVLGRTSADELKHAFANAGYSVTLTGPEAGPGGFTAVRDR